MSIDLPLQNWFLFSDRDTPKFNPTYGAYITAERFWKEECGKFDSPDWRSEEWSIHSALVPLSCLEEATTKILELPRFSSEIGWNGDGHFGFGESISWWDVQFFPFTLLLKHPITRKYWIELDRRFRIYHALIQKDETHYYHPTENIPVIEAGIDSHDIYDPTANVKIHRDYLCDFLSIVKMGLLISVISDRFANAESEEALQINCIENFNLDDLTKLTTVIHAPNMSGHRYFRGRSILHRNLIIQPYDTPRYERNPWPTIGEKLIDKSQLPLFIVNDEGRKKILPQNTYLPNYMDEGIGSFGYLWFRPEVLKRFLNDPGYRVYFHMRNWGAARLPGDKGTITVGINGHGFVNAFAPDIAKLTIPEQAHWSSYSSLPNGELCEEMFQTTMQCKPPHSPSVVDLVHRIRERLERAFRSIQDIELFSDYEPSSRDLCILSVGPLTDQYTEVLDISRILYQWLVETMKIDSIRACLDALHYKVDSNLKQIKLIENVMSAIGMTVQDARQLTASLVGLNNLRIASAHIRIEKIEPIIQLMRATTDAQTPRKVWNICLDNLMADLDSIVEHIENRSVT